MRCLFWNPDPVPETPCHGRRVVDKKTTPYAFLTLQRIQAVHGSHHILASWNFLGTNTYGKCTRDALRTCSFLLSGLGVLSFAYLSHPTTSLCLISHTRHMQSQAFGVHEWLFL